MNRITDVALVAANAATEVTLNPVAKYVYVLFTRWRICSGQNLDMYKEKCV